MRAISRYYRLQPVELRLSTGYNQLDILISTGHGRWFTLAGRLLLRLSDLAILGRPLAEVALDLGFNRWWARQGSNPRLKDYESRPQALVLLRCVAPGCVFAGHASTARVVANGLQQLATSCRPIVGTRPSEGPSRHPEGVARPARDRPWRRGGLRAVIPSRVQRSTSASVAFTVARTGG